MNDSTNELRQTIRDVSKSAGILPAFISVCGLVATAVSVIWLPTWMTLTLLALCGVYVMTVWWQCSKRIHAAETVVERASESRKPAVVESALVSRLESEVATLRASLADKESELEAMSQPAGEIAGPGLSDYTMVFLQAFQQLEKDVEDFGPECAEYMRRNFKRTLNSCGYEFIDYSDDVASGFDTERTPAVNEVVCTARAIVNKKTKKLVLRGHAFLPIK